MHLQEHEEYENLYESSVHNRPKSAKGPVQKHNEQNSHFYQQNCPKYQGNIFVSAARTSL